MVLNYAACIILGANMYGTVGLKGPRDWKHDLYRLLIQMSRADTSNIAPH